MEQAKGRLENAKCPKEQIAAHLRKADGGLFHPERMADVLESVLQIKATIGEVAQATSDTKPRTYSGGVIEKRNVFKAIVDRICYIKSVSGKWQ
jgi:hypothetical protein